MNWPYYIGLVLLTLAFGFASRGVNDWYVFVVVGAGIGSLRVGWRLDMKAKGEML